MQKFVFFGDIAAKAARSTTTLSTESHAHRVGLAPSPHGCLACRLRRRSVGRPESMVHARHGAAGICWHDPLKATHGEARLRSYSSAPPGRWSARGPRWPESQWQCVHVGSAVVWPVRRLTSTRGLRSVEIPDVIPVALRDATSRHVQPERAGRRRW